MQFSEFFLDLFRKQIIVDKIFSRVLSFSFSFWFGWFHSPHLNINNSKNHTKPPYMEPVNVLHLWEGYIAPTLS